MRQEAIAAPIPVDRRIAIAILNHAALGVDPDSTISRIATEHWLPAGYRILPHRGLEAPPSADLAIQHVALTHVPRPYLDLCAHYPRTINAAVADVSKRRIAGDLLEESDSYDGPVIVKTDLNHAGKAERLVRRRSRAWHERVLSMLERRLPRPWLGHLPEDRYLTFDRKRDVPSWVWRYRGLVVQPLHVERRGDLFAVNQWYFLAEGGCVLTSLARTPIVKLASVVERLPLHQDVPDSIRRRRAELKFDYGKFDYVTVDGTAHLLDANHTPHEGAEPTNPRVFEICRQMASGLRSLL